ncbi:MAG: hypothetical protein AB9900_12585 [Humidesulfovibrio sp.]
MECSFECSYDYSDCNMPTATREGLRTARKAHKCGECRETIQPGEQYRYESGIWDGEPASFKTCLDCLDLRNQFCCQGWEYGRVREMIREEIDECGGGVPLDGLGKLRPGARDVFLGMVENYWNREEYEDGASMRVSLRLDARLCVIHPRNDKYRFKEWTWQRRREAQRITVACWDAAEDTQRQTAQ